MHFLLLGASSRDFHTKSAPQSLTPRCLPQLQFVSSLPLIMFRSTSLYRSRSNLSLCVSSFCIEDLAIRPHLFGFLGQIPSAPWPRESATMNSVSHRRHNHGPPGPKRFCCFGAPI